MGATVGAMLTLGIMVVLVVAAASVAEDVAFGMGHGARGCSGPCSGRTRLQWLHQALLRQTLLHQTLQTRLHQALLRQTLLHQTVQTLLHQALLRQALLYRILPQQTLPQVLARAAVAHGMVRHRVEAAPHGRLAAASGRATLSLTNGCAAPSLSQTGLPTK